MIKLKNKYNDIEENKKENLLLKNKNKFIFFLIVVLLTIFTCYPYLNHLTLWGHDISFHLNRIIGISEGIKLGEFPVFINSNLIDGMGYSTAIFYPEVLLYIPAFFNLIGFGIGASYKLFIILITFCTFISMYYAINKIFQKKEIAILASLLYTFSLYRLYDVFIRAALGEIISFVFLPIVILGIYELIFRDKNKWYILALGLFGLSCSHVISLFLSVLLIIILCIFNIKHLYNDKLRIKKILICGVFSIILCCNIYLPMLEQIIDTKYRFSVGKSAYELSDNTAKASEILVDNLKSNSLIGSKKIPISGSTLNYGIGSILIVIPILLLFIRKDKANEKNNKENKIQINKINKQSSDDIIQEDNQRKFINQLILIGIFLVFAVTEFFPWKLFGFMSVIQFPWRLNLISTLVLSIATSYTIYNLIEHFVFFKYRKKILGIIYILIILITGIQLTNSGYKVNAFEYNELIESLPIGAGEYLPIQVGFDKEVTNIQKDIFDIEKKVVYSYVKNGNKIDFSYNEENKSKSGMIIVPLTYYKGYRAYIIDENNVKTDLKVSLSEYGTLKIDNSLQKKGVIHVCYKMTNIQIISILIALVAFSGTFIIRKNIKTNKK